MSEYVRYVNRLNKNIGPGLGRVDLELTERCNNNCIHCCVNLPPDDQDAKAREMSTAQVKAILTEIAAMGCMEVRFTGGEPLLRPDFKELYLFARKLGLRVLIFTNARLITPELADLLALVPPLVKVEITVYGMRSNSYEAVSRVPGSFVQFRKGVDLLLERNVPFIFKSAILPPNRHEMDEFEDWNSTITWANKHPDYAMFFDLRSRRDDWEKNRAIKAMRLTPEEGLAILTRNEKEYCRLNRQFAEKFMGPSGDLLFSCGVGNGLCIDAYGFAHPCMGIRAPELSEDILKINNSFNLEDVRARFANLRTLRATNPAYLDRCAVCFLKSFCGQCPGKSWTEHGNLDTPVEYFCKLAHIQACHIGWLEKGEQAWTVKNWRMRIKKEEQNTAKV